MKIKLDKICESTTFENFADKHSLVMSIQERKLDGYSKANQLKRYCASFKDTEVKDGSVLRNTYGQGNTLKEAIEDYSKKILGELLIVDAFKNKRREIQCPNEWEKKK